MNEKPFIELVICTYNNAEMLQGALAAIALQEVPQSLHWGVLVVNNNCTDHTTEIVEKAIETGLIPNLRMVIESTQGLTPARRCGATQTSAPWIAWVDDDCYLSPKWVAQAAKFAKAYPTCGAFGGRVTLDWEKTPPDYVMNFKYAFAEQERGAEIQSVSWLVGAGIVVNRSALTEVGWIAHQFLADRVGKTLVSGGDMEIALRLAAQYDLWYTPHCQLFHQIPAQRTTYDYLLKINFGLGCSHLFVSTLQWKQSYGMWVMASLKKAWRQTRYFGKEMVKAFIKRQPTQEYSVHLRFWLGYWVGIWQLVNLSSQQRKQLLGAAQANPQYSKSGAKLDGVML